MKQHILVVDDHSDIRELIGRYLKQQDYEVSLAENGEQMKEVLAKESIDLIIMDLMMPGDDGLTLCREVRHESNIPIIILSALGEDTDKIVGLEVGADDYLAKPFNPRELLARVRAVLRRHQQPATAPTDNKNSKFIYFDRWEFDLHKQQLVRDDGVVVSLSTGEFRLLKVFVQQPHVIFSRDQLLDMTQGRQAAPFDRSIDNQISRLRRKIEIDPKTPSLIKTVWGGGYSFNTDVQHP
ncbi:response regulator [Zooshikella marina]|uniref:response regulator n=1 Tax=Zooshikella ganghwensis TaxID=202772 RepID=UPI001BB0C8D4|nr:response regulator [Zooshikella ganghwensis]MBU2705414.1 response regulator [Zooshikella ganghwensis]